MRAFNKNTNRTIKQSLGRYLSILGIAFLGSTMLSGLLSTSPDMSTTGNNYYEKAQFMDLQVKSVYGFTEEDVDKIKTVDGIKSVFPTFSMDAVADISGKNYTLRIQGVGSDVKNSDINRLDLVEGEYPQKDNELVIVEPVEGLYQIKVGDTVRLDDEYTKNVKNEEYKIVGVVKSPEYISNGAISTTEGMGAINFELYGLKDNFKQDYYSDIYIKILKKEFENSLTDDGYSDAVDKVKEQIEKIGEKRTRIIPNDITKKLEKTKSDYKKFVAMGVSSKETEEGIAYLEGVLKANGDGKWYVLDRDVNVGYIAFTNDIKSTEGMAKIFPIIFFIVAAFVSLTTMARLVNEERIIVGTFKALGYSNYTIISKYLKYAISASLIGSVIGTFVGFRIFPLVIWNAYGMKYSLPDLDLKYYLGLGILSVITLTFVSALTTVFTIRNTLKQKTAELLVSKATSKGKRIFLERITPIWSRLAFLYKVTARNVFLDKKRMFMAIFGVVGCTSILITAFGLRDSVQGFTTYQYENIFKYDATVGYENETPSDDLTKLISDKKYINSSLKYRKNTIEINNKEGNKFTINLTIPDEAKTFTKFVELLDRDNGEKLRFIDDSAILSENVARRLKANIGDKVYIKLLNEEDKKEVTITGIAQNYQENYLYIGKGLYKKLFDEDLTCSNYFLITTDISQKMLNNEFVKIDDVTFIDFKKDLINQINDGLNSMNMVVVILIVAAGLLAFLVLFNVTNINVEERSREIATLKVLGFYDKETESYIFRETMTLTIIGCGIGLCVGAFMFLGVIRGIGTDFYMFNESLNPKSFIYSAICTIVFAIGINLFMRIKIRKVDMLESLKSIE
ncbi:MAG: FtsX-like permease family protein [Ruminiclostridium sp.]